MAAPASALPRFQGLGVDPVTGLRATVAYGVTADGSLVVGHAEGPAHGEAFLWTAGSGVIGLGDLPGGELSSTARAVSDGGEVVVGEAASDQGVEAFVWIAGVGMLGLGDLPGGSFESRALDVSADGSVVVGQGASGTGSSAAEAFRWTSAGGMVGLGKLPNTTRSVATAVSDDGALAVGIAGVGSSFEAFRWVQGSGLVGLGTFPGVTTQFSQAFASSADGAVIVGNAVSTLGVEAFRWTSQTGFVGLGDFPGSTFSSAARAVSADGNVVVGHGRAEAGSRAFLWTAEDGLRRIDELLAEDFGVDLGGWTLGQALGISPDGRFVVGTGANPEGNTEAWRVVLPVRCPPEPDPACGEAGAARIQISRGLRKPRLRWRMEDGSALDPAAGDPVVCLYTDGAAAGGLRPPGRLRAKLRRDASVAVFASDPRLEIPALPLAQGAVLRAELHDEAGACVGSSFEAPLVNEPRRYRAEAS